MAATRCKTLGGSRSHRSDGSCSVRGQSFLSSEGDLTSEGSSCSFRAVRGQQPATRLQLQAMAIRVYTKFSGPHLFPLLTPPSSRWTLKAVV